jgi:hypothetical protein
MSTPQLALKQEAELYLSLPDLFPKGKPDFRKKLNKYQVKKIKTAIKTVKQIGGDHAKQIVPMGRGRKRYMTEKELPIYMRGIFLSGGAKVNKKLEYSHNEVKYERKGSPRARSNDLDTSAEDAEFISSAKKILKRRKGRKATITAAGRAIGAVIPTREDDLIIKEGLRIFNKYAEMSYNNERRERRNANGTVYLTEAAHPSEWGMAILFEGKIEESPKKKTIKRKKK